MGADAGGIPQLLLGLGRPEGEHGHLAAVAFGDLHGFFQRTLLVRAGREAEGGRIDRQPVGVGGVLTLGNIGVVQNLFTSPDHRGKGIAETLLHTIIDVCNRAQFEAVLVERAEGCWAIPFYESRGFAQVGSYLTAKHTAKDKGASDA